LAIKKAYYDLLGIKYREGVGTQVMFVLTDGCYAVQSDEYVKKAKSAGIYTVLIGVGVTKSELRGHPFDELHNIKEIEELDGVVKAVITTIQKKVRKLAGLDEVV
jgi:hypothetical protein